MADIVKRGVGAPSKLTPELQTKFCNYVREGNKLTTVCKLVRISYVTFLDWMSLGEIGESAVHVAFRETVLQADAECEEELVKQWKKLNKTTKDYRSLQSFLSLRHTWQDAPTKIIHETTSKQSQPLIDISALSIEDQEHFVRMLTQIQTKQIETKKDPTETS